MLTLRSLTAIALAGLLATLLGCSPAEEPAPEPVVAEPVLVTLQTSLGQIVLELNAAAAPVTVDNFLAYVDEGFYNGTIFHRVIDGFMIQGGGFSADMQKKPTRAPIVNEADNGLSNVTGSIAMARTSAPNSATAQFFINVKDNLNLDFSAATPGGHGYAVFGKVIEGMDVVDAIRAVTTGVRGNYRDVPVEPVIIERARRSAP